MQGIYTYIPDTNYVPREYSVAAILLLLFMVIIIIIIIIIIINKVTTKSTIYLKKALISVFSSQSATYNRTPVIRPSSYPDRLCPSDKYLLLMRPIFKEKSNYPEFMYIRTAPHSN